jgi:hypothetical protein
MADSNDLQKQISELSQTSTNLLLENVLRKHNVKLSNKNLSREERAKIKKLVSDLQASFQKLQKQDKQ